MPAPLTPQRLADLVDLGERPRVADWSLRAALCRYAQPQPVRASAVLSLVRRIDGVFASHLPALRADGPSLLARAEEEGAGDGLPAVDTGDEENEEAVLVGVLALAIDLDALGDVIATWAVDRVPERPDALIDDAVERLTDGLTELGVPEKTAPPRGARGRG